MNATLDHPAVSRYLADLDRAATVLPPGRRAELLAEIGEHLQDSLAGATTDPKTGTVDDAAVHAVLTRLGDPVEIVRAEGLPERGDLGGTVRVSRWGGTEIAAVLLLTLGHLLLFFIGPLVGLILVWGSDQWTRRQKRIATTLVLTPLLLLLVPVLGLLAVRF